VASVIADHGAIIDVESVSGQTVFRMNFPIAPNLKHSAGEVRQ
jgi:nitrogen-specific signal transduction histidine kinase